MLYAFVRRALGASTAACVVSFCSKSSFADVDGSAKRLTASASASASASREVFEAQEAARRSARVTARAARGAREPSPVQTFLTSLGPDAGLYVWGGFSLAILGALAFGAVGSARSDRSRTVIAAAEKLMLKHGALRREFGAVLAAGNYQITASRAAAHGWFSARVVGAGAEIPVSALARVHFAAVKEAGDWRFSEMRLEVPSEGDRVTSVEVVSTGREGGENK
jgi:hypothetical protein